RSRRDADCSGDVLARPALAAEGFDGHDRGCRRGPVQVMGPGGAIVQAFDAFGLEARHPLAHCLDRHAESGRDSRRRLSLNHHPPHKFGSTVRREPGILMNVHPVLREDAEASQLQLPRSEPEGQPNESSQLVRLNGLKLVPGMPVESFIQTGERTVISYLTKPLQDQIMKAWREK